VRAYACVRVYVLAASGKRASVGGSALQYVPSMEQEILGVSEAILGVF